MFEKAAETYKKKNDKYSGMFQKAVQTYQARNWEEDASQPLDGDSAANNPIAPALILAKRDGNVAAAKELLDNAPYVQTGRDGINSYADAVAEIERQDAAAKAAAVQATMQPMGYGGLSKALRDGSMPKKKNTKVKETRREGNPKYNDDYVPGVDYPKFRPYDDVEKELADVQARRDSDFNTRFPEAEALVQRSIGGKDADADRQLRELAQQYADENAAYDARIAELKKEAKDSKNKTVLQRRERAAKQTVDTEQARFSSPELRTIDEKIKNAEAELAAAESAQTTVEDAERALREYEDELRANGVTEQYFGEDSRYIELAQAASDAKKSAASQKNAADANLYALRGAKTLASVSEEDRAAILSGVRVMRGNSAAGMNTSIPQTFDFSTGKYRVLTEDEYKQIKADYNAAIRRLKESGVSDADIRRMTTTLEQSADAMIAAGGNVQTAAFALQYPTLASAISVVSNLASGVTVGGAEIGRVVGNAFRGEGYKAPMNINGAAYAPVRATNDIRGTIAERIEEGNGFGGKVGSFAYQTLMSTADSVVASVLGNVGGAAAIGGSAFASAIVDAKESGVSDEQALMTGICAGIFETLFERVSIGNFNKLKEVPPATLRDVALNILKSTGVNASEEGATEIANILADTIINGDYSVYAKAYQSYLAAGKSEKEAERLAKQDMIKQVGMAAFGGAVQGFFMGGIGTTWGYFGNRDANRAAGAYFTDENGRINAENRNALIGEGLASGNEEIRAYAGTLEDKRTMSQAEAGQLYRMLVAQTQGNYSEVKGQAENGEKQAVSGETDATAQENTPAVVQQSEPRTETPDFSDRSLDEPISETEFRAAYAARVAREAAAERAKTQADTDLGNMLSGELTNGRADEIAKSQSLANAFEALTGEKLTGTLAEKRKHLKAMQTFAAEKLRDARADARMTALKTADTREKMRAAVGTAGQAVYDAGYDAGVAEYKLRGFAGDALLAPSELYNANFGAYYRQGYRGDAFDFSGNAVIGEADARRIFEAGRRDAKADTYLNAAERSAFEHGVSAEKGATAKRLSQVLGREILFIDAGADFHGCTIDGVIYLGAKSDRSVLATVAHEYTHLLEGKGLYTKLRDFVFDTLAGEGATAVDLRAAKRAEHELYAGLDDAQIDREIVAEFVETRLLTDEQVMREVVRREGKSFARRLLDTLRGLIEKVKAALHIGNADAEQLKMLERGRDILAEVIRSEETSEAADGIAFAFVGKNKNGIRKYETDFPADMPQAERERLFKERLATIFNLGAVELKTDVKKIKVQADRFTYQKNKYGDKGDISAKVNALYDLVDILETSIFKSVGMEPSFANGNLKPKNLAHKDVKYWYKFENHIVLDGVPYKVVFNIRDKGKEQYQYLIAFDEETTQNTANTKKKTPTSDTAADGQLRAFMQESSNTTVSQKNSGVNSKYTQNSKNDADIDGFSVGGVETDSEGNALSEAQQEFFSGSLVTDEDGALLPVYHATDSAEFTVFDKSKLGYNTDGNTSDEGMAATAHVGFWFNTKDLTGEAGSRAEKVYLNLTNPYELTSLDVLAEEIKALGEGETPAEMGEAYATDLWLRGYDGIEIRHDEEFGGTSYVAFDENQIKRTTNKNPTKDADIRFSVGGVNAKTAEVGRLADAERMEQGGADSETVRRETGWYRGYDGKWRFEIDDSKMRFINRREESRRTWKLDELIRHDALFAAYPELRNYTVLNFAFEDGINGVFSPGLNRIMLNPNLDRAGKRAALIHEIQHAIQVIEGFAAGSSTDYWQDAFVTDEEKRTERHLLELSRKNRLLEEDMYRLLEDTPDARRDALRATLVKRHGEKAVREFTDTYNHLLNLQKQREMRAEQAYRNTAGEIEAANVASRLSLSAKQRAETRPDIDRTDVRFSKKRSMFSMEARQKDTDITVDDLQAIRAIGRKSVNDFTADDVRATEKWARKFYRELGTKSPFFRAWFGDWRAEDGGKINTVVASESSGKNPRGIFKNKDTGWDITSSSVGYDETVSHSGKDKRSLAAMRTIDKLLENAVLLDTEISAYGRGKKSVYTAFMHKFYALIYIDGAPNIAKIAVDESYMPGQSDTNKKFYHVRAIQIEAVPSVGIGNSHTPIMEKTASTISISDLYALVKRYDKDFKPKAVNPALLNEDGTPKVIYHGTNSEAFTVFDSDKSGRVKKSVLGDGYYFAAEEESATHYGEHVIPVYLNMENPYKVYARDGGMRAQMAEDFNMDANAISRGDIQSILQANGYDGVLLYSSKYAADGDFSTAVVFDNTQIKSATDNVGTFDRENPDIRFSVGGEQTDADADAEVSDADKRFAPVESAIKLLQGGADLWRTLRETGTQPNQIALRMATSGESDAAIRELTGLYRDALGVWTYDKAWFDAHVPDIADTRELRAGYKLGTVDEQLLGLAPEEVKASRRRLLDSAKLPADADAMRVRQTAANLHRGLRPTAAEFAEDRKTAAAKEAARLITAEKVPSADAAIRTGALLTDIADVLEKKKVRAETITRLTAQVRGENGAWETDNAAMTKIIRAGSKQLDVQDFTDFLFENAKELTESSYNSQYGHRETYALDKLGVQIQNPIVDIAKYGTKPSELIANEREQEELKRYIENGYAHAVHPTTAERADARDVAAGIRTLGQISQDSRREVVLDLVYANLARRGLRDNGIETFYMVQKQRYAEELAQNIFKMSIEPGKKAVQQWRLTANTALRNNRMVFGEEVGRYLNETIFEKVVENEGERQRFMQREIDKIRKLKLTKLESQAVQMLAEDTKESRLAFYELLKGKGKKLDVEKCRAAVTVFRECYNLYYDAINEFLVMHGYKPIGFQKNYMPRLQKEADVSALRERLNALGIETEEVTELPAEIAGRTETFKPGKKYNPFFEHRTSKENKNVQYDALGGFDSYITYLSEVLYHTDDIQKLRTLAGVLRERYASGAVSKNIADLKEQLYSPDPDKSFADIEAKLTAAYDAVKLNNYFGTYATWLDDYTNNIAGKQTSFDRAFEYNLGRKTLNLGKRLNNTYSDAVIVGNLSSAFNQIVQLPFALTECGIRNMTRAFVDMLPGNDRLNKTAEFDKKSTFLAGKRGVDYASERAWNEKVTAAGGKFFEAVDMAVSRLILRAKYYQVTEANPNIGFDAAVREADRYISAMVGNRMKGAKPVLFNQKNVITRTLAAFQLEQLNFVEYVARDVPAKYRAYYKAHGTHATVRKIARELISALINVFVFNRLAELLYGQTPAAGDALGILVDSLGAGWNLTGNDFLLTLADDLCRTMTGERKLGTKERGDFSTQNALGAFGDEVGDDVPLVNNILAMLGVTNSKLPLPQIKAVTKAASGDFKGAAAQIPSDLATWVPFGSQIKKTVRGAKLIADKGMYSSSGKLMFASDMNLWDCIRAVLFGPTANEEYRESFFGGRYLSAEETALWQQMRAAGGKPEESFDALQDVYNAGAAVREADPDAPSAEVKAAKVEKIDDLPLNGRLKALLLYGDVATTNEKAVMDALEVTLQVDHMKVYRFMSGFVLQEKVADKREYLKHDLILTDAEKATVYYHYFANDDAQDFIDELRRRGGKDADIYKVLAASYGREEEKITSADRATAIADSSLPASAKEEAMYELISDELHDKYTAVQDAGGSVDEFLAAYAATRGITSDKDRAGNTVALSKARKMKKAIDAAVPDAPKKVRRALYSAFGVSKSVWY